MFFFERERRAAPGANDSSSQHYLRESHSRRAASADNWAANSPTTNSNASTRPSVRRGRCSLHLCTPFPTAPCNVFVWRTHTRLIWGARRMCERSDFEPWKDMFPKWEERYYELCIEYMNTINEIYYRCDFYNMLTNNAFARESDVHHYFCLLNIKYVVNF